MDRDKCIEYLTSYSKGKLSRVDAEEILTSYVCDRGYESKKEFVPSLTAIINIHYLLADAFDYYKRLYNIYTIYEKPASLRFSGELQAILFY